MDFIMVTIGSWRDNMENIWIMRGMRMAVTCFAQQGLRLKVSGLVFKSLRIQVERLLIKGAPTPTRSRVFFLSGGSGAGRWVQHHDSADDSKHDHKTEMKLAHVIRTCLTWSTRS